MTSRAQPARPSTRLSLGLIVLLAGAAIEVALVALLPASGALSLLLGWALVLTGGWLTLSALLTSAIQRKAPSTTHSAVNKRLAKPYVVSALLTSPVFLLSLVVMQTEPDFRYLLLGLIFAFFPVLLIAALVGIAVLAIAWWRFVTEAGANAQTASPQDGLHQ